MIYITMCWRGKDWRDYTNLRNYPLISLGWPGVGLFMLHGVGRDEGGGQYIMDTIGL